MIICKQV